MKWLHTSDCHFMNTLPSFSVKIVIGVRCMKRKKTILKLSSINCPLAHGDHGYASTLLKQF